MTFSAFALSLRAIDALLGQVQDPAHVGDQAMVRRQHRAAARGGADLRVLEQLRRASVRVAAEAELVVEPPEVDAQRGPQHSEQHGADRAQVHSFRARPSLSIVQPATATAANIITISDGTSR